MLRKSCLSGQLPARGRAERTARLAGADPAQWPGHARRERRTLRRAEELDELREDNSAAQPAPGLPQGADEAVDRALRVQGHDVPYVEEAGHFIRHAASCSKVDVLPLRCALAALSGEPPRQRRNGAHDCSAESGCRGHDRVSAQRSPALGEPARSEAAAADTRDVRSPGAPRAEVAASPAGFLFLSEVFFSLQHLCSSSSLLRTPSLLCAPPWPSPPPGRWW